MHFSMINLNYKTHFPTFYTIKFLTLTLTIAICQKNINKHKYKLNIIPKKCKILPCNLFSLFCDNTKSFQRM